MPQLISNRYHAYSVLNHHACVCMPQGVDRRMRKPRAFYESAHPLRGGCRENWRTIVAGEHPVILRITCPRIPQQFLLPILPCFIRHQYIKKCRRQMQRPFGAGRFYPVHIAADAGCIVPGMPDIDHVVIHVNVVPLQPQQFRAAKPRHQITDDECTPFDRLKAQHLQHTPCVFFLQVFRFCVRLWRLLCVRTGI